MCRHDQFAHIFKSRFWTLPYCFEQCTLSRFRLGIDEIHDCALMLSNNAGMRFGYKISYRCRMPVIATSKSIIGIHALLHYRPFAGGGHDKAVKIELESIRDCIVVHTRRKPAAAH